MWGFSHCDHDRCESHNNASLTLICYISFSIGCEDKNFHFVTLGSHPKLNLLNTSEGSYFTPHTK